MSSRRKEKCVCGFETRSDYLRKHLSACTALPIINDLKNENNILISRLRVYHEIANKHDEVSYLRNQLEIKNKIIEEKDEEIKRLSCNQNITNNFSVTNVLNIFPFGKEPDVHEDKVRDLLHTPADSVPLYIKMKHFRDGLSNVRIKNDDIEVVEENEFGELNWVLKDKTSTIFQITDNNLGEFHSVYGCTDFIWKRWFITSKFHESGYTRTKQFKDLLQKVELVFTMD